jgi:SAM-dependent methyltransferase
MTTVPEPDPDVVGHYELDEEHARLLTSPSGRLELQRSQRILLRHLPPAPARVLDVGGGTGVYASWLESLGYEVEVIDLTPVHVRRCVDAGLRAEIGDARALVRGDASYDVVLLMGPLYHLPSAADRARVWSEAFRVVRPGGLVAAATIGRFAGLLDGMSRRWDALLEHRALVLLELEDGAHFNPEGADLFTTAYFHHPDELVPEATAAGFVDPLVTAVEGPAWLLSTLREQPVETFVELLDAIEHEPSLLGASAHVLTTARKPS